MLTIGVIGTKLEVDADADVVDAPAAGVVGLDDVVDVDAGDVRCGVDRQARERGRRWVAMTFAVSVLEPEVAGHDVDGATGMHARHPRDLAGRLGRAVHHVDAATEVEDAHQDEHERDDDERELDERLTAAAGASAAGPKVSRVCMSSTSARPVVGDDRSSGSSSRSCCGPGSGPGSCSSGRCVRSPKMIVRSSRHPTGRCPRRSGSWPMTLGGKAHASGVGVGRRRRRWRPLASASASASHSER